MTSLTLLGMDIGKHSFHLHGQNAQGQMVLRKKGASQKTEKIVR